MNKSIISEARIRNIVEHEIMIQSIVQENLWNDGSAAAEKLKKIIAKKFGNQIKKWYDELKKLTSIKSDTEDHGFSVLKAAMQKSGESFVLDDRLKLAKQLNSLGSKGYESTVSSELQGVNKTLSNESASYKAGLYDVLVTEQPAVKSQRNLNEDFGVTAALGLALGSFGGAHLIFKGLAALAGYLKMTKTQKLFSHWAHVLHDVESKTLNKVVPDKLAYVFYRMGRGAAAKFLPFVDLKNKKPIAFAEFKSDSKLKMNVKQAMYKLLLSYLLVHGIVGALKAGMSVLGVAEGAASTVKGVEIAAGIKGAATVAKTVQ